MFATIAANAASSADSLAALPPALPQEANTAFKIRAVVEGSLPDSLHKIPIEKRFTKDYVRNVSACRSAGTG